MNNEISAPITTAVTADAKSNPLFYKILVVLAMMSVIAGTLTGVMTYIQVGYSDSFVVIWLEAFLTTAVILMPVGLVMMSLVSKLIAKLLPHIAESARNPIVGVIMAVIMESIMAFTTTAKNIGFANRSEFASAWLEVFLVALPVGLSLMLIISMTVKPKIEKFLKS
ncbi:DUF2798 domain-containing protein [Agarivorans sp. DSG3-1]|uniref:DUF2798 domain-containing protein n=1 Tax=Agarivorans sp. DSG3-1 TaxID=3342249 RepID=UPI00398F58E8